MIRPLVVAALVLLSIAAPAQAADPSGAPLWTQYPLGPPVPTPTRPAAAATVATPQVAEANVATVPREDFDAFSIGFVIAASAALFGGLMVLRNERHRLAHNRDDRALRALRGLVVGERGWSTMERRRRRLSRSARRRAGPR